VIISLEILNILETDDNLGEGKFFLSDTLEWLEYLEDTDYYVNFLG
jgi:hypothetical protein